MSAGSPNRLGARACSAALAIVLCCSPLLPTSAYAAGEQGAGQPQETPPASQNQEPETLSNASVDLQGASDPASQPRRSDSSSAPAEPASTEGAGDGGADANAAAAQERLEQAQAVYDLMGSLLADVERLSAECEEAERIHAQAVEAFQERRASLDRANEELEAQKALLSDFVVDMYKQGGMAPYYEVVLKSASYQEFLTSWRMMNEVALYGRDEIRRQNDAIRMLKAEVEALENAVDQTEEDMDRARSGVARAELSRLAVAPHAASLRVEAAILLDDAALYAEAIAELDAANAALDEAIAGGLANQAGLDGDGVFAHPLPDATISSGFGYRSFDNSFHKGVDLAMPEGTPYYAAAAGTVTAVTNDGGYNGGAGNWIVIDHGDGLVTKYMHSFATLVNAGDWVERGQVIGLVGNTGNSSGAHLHFQVEINDVAVDPLVYLASGGG